jgi:hypothetical protein
VKADTEMKIRTKFFSEQKSLLKVLVFAIKEFHGGKL